MSWSRLWPDSITRVSLTCLQLAQNFPETSRRRLGEVSDLLQTCSRERQLLLERQSILGDIAAVSKTSPRQLLV